LQSETGRTLLENAGLDAEALDSVVLIMDGKAYQKSTAALRVSRRLGGLWPALYAFIIVPRPIRDWVYDVIARNRYAWWGKQDACMIPTPEIRDRFIDG
ncbi:MAG: DCC1-like thiol-disulfide oxidoreductase family protein, partial [Verrucomicrobiota bacterium]